MLFDHCDFTKIDDDGIDILGTWTRVLDQIDSRTLHLQSPASIKAGDHIQLWDWSLKASRAEAIVLQVSANPDRSINATLDRDVKTERVGAGDGSRSEPPPTSTASTGLLISTPSESRP